MSNDWTDVAAAEDLFDGASIAVQVQGLDIALHCVDGLPYATGNLCTHGLARLCEGFLEGHEIECPLHQGRFDIRTGQPSAAPPDIPIPVYPARIVGGRVLLQLPPPGGG